jgi:hypothetical protein
MFENFRPWSVAEVAVIVSFAVVCCIASGGA